jgi:hypothetical protein
MDRVKQCDLLLLHSCVKKYLTEQKNQMKVMEQNAIKIVAELSVITVPYGIKPADLAKAKKWGYSFQQNSTTKTMSYSEFRQKLQVVCNITDQYEHFYNFSEVFWMECDRIIGSYKKDLNKPIHKTFCGSQAQPIKDSETEKLCELYFIEMSKYLDGDAIETIVDETLHLSGRPIQPSISEKPQPQPQGQDEEDENTIFEGLNYHDLSRVNINQKYKYEKRCHFKDTINQYQGLQHKTIPDKVIEDVKEMIINHGLYQEHLEDPYILVSKEHIRQFLNGSKHNKFYEDQQLIFSKITNKPCPNITKYEKQLFEDFDALVDVFLKLKLKRKNFLNNHYVLRQLLRRQGYKVPGDDLNILKTPNRIKEHDEIYQMCCEQLGWNFYPVS